MPNFDNADDLDDNILSPEKSIQELIMGSRTKSKLSEWLNVLKSKEGKQLSNGGSSDENRGSANSFDGNEIEVNSSIPLL